MKIKIMFTLLISIALMLSACSQNQSKQQASGNTSDAEGYPSKPIEIVVGFGEGGGTDTMARTLQPMLQKELGVAVAVKNRPGASSALALEYVSEQKADGHTILLQTDLVRVFPTMGMTDLTYKDFEQVGIGAMGIANFVVKDKSNLKTFDDLVQLLKNEGAKVGVAAIGDPWHLTLEILNNVIDGKAEIITYDSGSNAAMAAMKGEVDFSISGVNEVADLLRSGDLRSLAVMDNKPFEVDGLGTIAPVTEFVADLDKFVPEGTWWGPAVKEGTPEIIVEKIKKAYNKAINSNEFKEFAKNKAIVLTDIQDSQEYTQKATEKTSWLLWDIGVGKRSPEEVGITRANE
ncbi:tripartite tricarboxylate transporter substrate binding protein [Metabacillus idriensis]|uniref:tripartite tricarboxylate transporter substrate binding protein n=1 Tax=Metabacillus idriensis TaxID=324768 RepID=UPI00174A2469|nr:tripartite tricarboxylate transporter substrate binding protein [Metabacillus idriensis]